MESGLRAEEIAARLGVSRAALYRYEKGEVIKLDTVKRLAELLKVSPLSLLGIGVEYYSRPVGYFERIRQIEEGADQILQAFGPLCYLTTTDAYDAALAEAMAELASGASPGGSSGASSGASSDEGTRITAEQVMTLLAARKRSYLLRRPSIIAMIASGAVRGFLEQGILPSASLRETTRQRCRLVAASEMERIAEQMETEPMGLQFGLLSSSEPSSAFVILRGRDRATLAVNPFRADSGPVQQTGVAMVTGADEAIGAHQRVAESMWRDAVRGPPAAAAVRALIAAHGTKPGA